MNVYLTWWLLWFGPWLPVVTVPTPTAVVLPFRRAS